MHQQRSISKKSQKTFPIFTDVRGHDHGSRDQVTSGDDRTFYLDGRGDVQVMKENKHDNHPKRKHDSCKSRGMRFCKNYSYCALVEILQITIVVCQNLKTHHFHFSKTVSAFQNHCY